MQYLITAATVASLFSSGVALDIDFTNQGEPDIDSLPSKFRN
jgi:hypothetical protein